MWGQQIFTNVSQYWDFVLPAKVRLMLANDIGFLLVADNLFYIYLK
jgi:hypothetical protein